MIHFDMKAFVCDAPARSCLKYTVGHTGCYSCERCQDKGEWQNRVVFNEDTEFLPCTDNDFNSFLYEGNHQKSKTPLIDFGISCVSHFTLDYMHLVCLGVMKRMLVFLKQGPRNCKLSNAQRS